MRRRKRRIHGQSEVELNLAAMLDMAFQLLAFFVLTFRQTPLEGQIALRLPPPQATIVVAGGEAAGSDTENKNPLQGMNTLTVSISADPASGAINGLRVGESPVTGIAALDGRLQELFRDQGNPFDQVIIQVSESCRYDELMKIIDVCTHQTLPDGKKLSKLSFVELPGG
jgi:biopolymer transport protein ExbD